MSEESYKITEKGMEFALEILEREGLLPKETGSIDVDAMQLSAACDRYIEASVAKGKKRSEDECSDAIMISCFAAYLDDLSKRIAN